MKQVLFALLIIVATGCASIISGKTQQLTVNSNVSGAEVLLNGRVLGQTPFIGSVERSDNGAVIEVRKEGFETKKYALKSTINGVFWVNILSGGVLGSSTDYSTKSMYEYAPDIINVDLVKK